MDKLQYDVKCKKSFQRTLIGKPQGLILKAHSQGGLHIFSVYILHSESNFNEQER